MSELEKPQSPEGEASKSIAARILGGFREFFEVLRGGGLSLRRFLAIVSLILLSGSLGFSLWAFQRMADRRPKAQNKLEECKELKCTLSVLEAHIKEQEAMAAVRDASVNLGQFELSLVGIGNGERGQSGILLEMDVSVQFDSAETGRWVRANLAPLRGLVAGSMSTLTHVTKADLMTPEGKAIIRDRIRDRVAQSLPSGKVRDVYFNAYLLK